MKQAAMLKARIDDELRMGVFDYATHFPNSPHAELQEIPAFVDMAELYLASLKGEKALSTRKGYRKTLNTYFVPWLDTRRIDRINSGHIRQAIADSGLGEKSPKTFNNAMTPLRGLFAYAIDFDHIKENPCDRIAFRKWQPPEPEPLDHEQIAAVLGWVERMRPDWLPYFQWAIGTGMRPSEQIAVKWSDIDHSRGLVRVARARVEREVKEVTKTNYARLIELTDLAWAAINAQKEKTFLAGGWLFLNPNTGKQIDDHKAPRLVWHAALKGCGIPKRDAYATRDTYTSILLSAGTPVIAVSSQTGNSVQMLLKHYGRWIPGDVSTADAFNKSLGLRLGLRARSPKGVVQTNQPHSKGNKP